MDPDFFEAPAMRETGWRGARRKGRHLITRGAVHGFHGDLCEREWAHEVSPECKCKLCGEQCKGYHVYKCRERGQLEGMGMFLT